MTTKMQKTASATFWTLGMLTIFALGLVVGLKMVHLGSTELSVVGSIPITTQNGVPGRATIYVHPEDPIYPCAKETAHVLASAWPDEILMHVPSRIRQISRKLTRRQCGRPITILIDVARMAE